MTKARVPLRSFLRPAIGGAVSTLLLSSLSGCGATRASISARMDAADANPQTVVIADEGAASHKEQTPPRTIPAPIQLVSHDPDQEPPAETPLSPVPLAGEMNSSEASNGLGATLSQLEFAAATRNPDLIRLQQEAAAAAAKANYVDKLPDPSVGANVFGQPMMFADGPMRAEVEVMQMIPWLERLDAKAQQACYEAYVLQQMYKAQRLQVLADLRAAWFKLYVLGRQLEVNRENQQLLESLVETANARVAAGQAGPGDVLLGTLELATLQEQIISDEQQVISTIAEINRLAGRPAETPVAIPDSIEAVLPEWSHPMLRDLAFQKQPEIAAARLRAAATRWGVEVARLERRPDLTLRSTWFVMDAMDAWSVGAQVTVPLWRQKYDAMEQEATWDHFASQSAVETSLQKYDAALRDLWEQAKAAQRTAALYEATIIPQARQTLDADVQALTDNTVDFERVIEDVRNLLTLELGYHRALAQLATAVARIQQAVGTDLAPLPVEMQPAPSDAPPASDLAPSFPESEPLP